MSIARTMADANKEDHSNGAAFDDYFESLGKKANQLSSQNQVNDNAVAVDVNKSSKPANDKIDTEDDGDQRAVDEIESLCMNCHEDGTTRLLLTRIPFFREIIIMSFSCPHCHFKNAEIQSAGEIQQKGSKFELRLTETSDLSRQIVKSDSCVAKFIELDIEVPAGRGQLTNVEGLLSMILEDLQMQQPERKEQLPEIYAKIEELIATGRRMLAGSSFPFRLSLDDPAGNSWIEPDQKDGVGKWSKIEYARTPEQNEALALAGDTAEGEPPGLNKPDTLQAGNTGTVDENEDILPNEVYSFPASCPGCAKSCVTHMKMVDIPHFKQVVIMSTVCDHCGYRSNEVKTGGEVSEKGQKITLKVSSPTDLARDILKSESCSLECPELSLSVNPGTLGGRFTTVEGLLTQVRNDLHQQIFDIGDDEGAGGDSLAPESKSNWAKFFSGMDAAIQGEIEFTIILTDPLASSYVQNICLPDDDLQIQTEDYERTAEEEEELGLTDMKTEDYQDENADIERNVNVTEEEAGMK